MAVRVLFIFRNHYQMLTVVHFYHGRVAGAWRAHGGRMAYTIAT